MRRILDILLGRTRPIRSKLERLFAISTAYLTLTANLRLTASGRAGVCFRPLESSEFQSLSQELERILKISGRETDTTIDAVEDEFGFQWVILQDSQFEDLVATIHLVSLTLEDKGFGEQLLAAVFKFLDREKPIFWIYNYKRGNFYPFVPRGGRG
ncbi:MAG: PspA-associated protein PspAB, partial [Chloroflexota bacterium]